MKILVTGGAAGLGLAISQHLLAAGHEVAVTYRSSVSAAQKLCSDHAGCQAYPCDFTDARSLESFLRQIEEIQPEGLVNNALHSLKITHFQKYTADDFLGSFVSNTLPVLRITQSCLTQFRLRKFGRIVNVLSAAMLNRPPLGYSDYLANKAYLLAMSKSWAAENARFNISSNCVSPSLMRTRLMRDTDERLFELAAQDNPLGRLVEVEEVARVVGMLLTLSPQTNSVNIPINGGVDVQ